MRHTLSICREEGGFLMDRGELGREGGVVCRCIVWSDVFCVGPAEYSVVMLGGEGGG